MSHDRRFLERIATRIVSIQQEQVELCPGKFLDFKERRGKDLASLEAEKFAVLSARQSSSIPLNKNAMYDAHRKRRKERERRKKRKVEQIEKLVALNEEALAQKRSVLSEHPPDDWEQLIRLAEEARLLLKKLDGLVEEWTALSSKIESL
ncbi:hypothetical protein [Pajaroellobacter abortibovis]|uniref:ABC transporter Uup C-terminal domain-containing protein n=1 Tax=Pajaroellobacter abortibovis TaxID=1882918 RepID=A0A1L6MVC0_9BACT|nr:hypothetical protein [Pajaroellobacter abortibovis]APR99459.1 hypothetical protein BCY86_01250 [Pajaroellobacter abortibovis]